MKIWLIILLFSSPILGIAQMNWVAVEDLSDSLKANPKPVYAFIHTDWCGYCKKMEKKTFMEEKVLKRLQSDYYCITINAESPETITFFGKEYVSEVQSNGKYLNQLAVLLATTDGKMSYPTNVFLTPNLVVERQYPTYLSKSDFLYVLSDLRKNHKKR